MLLASVLLVAAVAARRAYADGRFRSRTTQPEPTEAEPLLPADQLGERATLLQFSSAFCAPCRTTRGVLGDVAAGTPGVSHVEIDAESRLDLVRRVGVMRTPTTLVLDAAGREVLRAAGAPRREQVVQSLVRLGVSNGGQQSHEAERRHG